MKRNKYASDRRKYETDRRRYHSSSDSDDNYQYKQQHQYKRKISNIAFPDYRHATEKHHSRSKMSHSGRKKFEERPRTPPPPIISSELVRSNEPSSGRVERIFGSMHRFSDDSPPPPLRFSNDERNERLIMEPKYTNEFLNPLDNSSSLNEDQMLKNLISDIILPQKGQENTGKIILSVVDEGENVEILNKVTWRRVECALCKVYLEIMHDNPGPPPVCRDSGSFLGCAKLIECADERSRRLFTQAISRVGSVWPGAKLRVVNPNDISASEFRLRATAIVPPEPSTSKAILECIQISNPDIHTNNWRVVNVGAPSRLTKERNIIISFNMESLTAIKQHDGVIGYGLNYIKLKISKRDLCRVQRSKGESNDMSTSILFNNRKRSWTAAKYDIDQNSDDAVLISESEDEYYNFEF